MTTFLDETQPLAHCPGCGHPHVLRALDEALARCGTPPHRVVLVSDIGCVGLADPYFPTLHTVHTLHGRSAAVAAGLLLGDRARGEAPMKAIVLVGDGGATIGLLHLVHAAQLDVDVTVVLHNNLVYGMTGGQHSGLTPEGMPTTTTPEGNPVRPLDVARILEGAGAGYYARAKAPGADLVPLLTEAIRHPGFACVEALELCPTFASRVGGITGRDLDAMLEAGGPGTGVLYRRSPAPPAAARAVASDRDPLATTVQPRPAEHRLDRPVRLVVAGRAGERVQGAARLAAMAAAAAGLRVAVRTDNPVTQGRGFSLADVTFSPTEVDGADLGVPDVVVATAAEGLAELRSRDLLGGGARGGRTLLDAGLEASPDLGAARSDLRARFGPKSAALGALAGEITRAGWWGRTPWDAAFETLDAQARGDAERTLRLAAPGLWGPKGPSED